MKLASKISIVALGLVFLTACSTTRRQARSVAPPVPTGIIGSWTQVGGPLLAKFGDTEFESINSTTNDVVAAGVYKFNSSEDIRLEWVGALSNGKQTAQCRLATPLLLDCKPSNGSGFQLQRSSAAATT